MHRLITRDLHVRRGLTMSSGRLIISLGTMAAIAGFRTSLFAVPDDGIAVAIIYDTSGSMKEQVRDRAGKLSPKYVIANRALEGVTARIDTFAANAASEGSRKVQAGLFVF